SVSADVDWITFVKAIDGFSATVSENSEHLQTRSGIITIDNGENTMKIFVNQGDGQGAPELLYPNLSSDEKQPTSRPVGGIKLEFKEYYANYVGVRIYEASASENILVYEKIVPRKVDFLHIPNENEGCGFKANTVYKIELSGHYSTSCNENEVEHDVERNSFYVYMTNNGHDILVEGSSHYEYKGYGNVTVNLYSTNTWTYSTDVDWIHVEDYELVACHQDIEKVDMKLDPNYTENTRTGIVTFYCGEKTATVKIIQESLYPRFIYPNISQDMSKPTILQSSGLILGTVYESATYATYSNGSWSDENSWGSDSLGEYTLIPDNSYMSDILYRFTLKSGEETSVYYAKFKADSSKNYVLLRDTSLGDVIDLNINVSTGKTTYDIKMKANASWKIESDVSWLSSSSMSGSKRTSWRTLTITAQENNTDRARTGVLSFKVGDTVCATLTVTQPSGDYIELFEKDEIWGYIHYDSEASFKLCDGSGGSKRLYAWANSTWGAESHSSWITIKGKTSVDNIKSGKYIDIELEKNTTDSIRTGSVTVFCGNESQVITVTQVPGMDIPTLVSPNISTDYKNPSSVKYEDMKLTWNAVEGAKYYKIEVLPADRALLLPDSSFYSFITEIQDIGNSTYSCVIPKTAFSLNMETYDYVYIRAYDEYGYYVYDSFYFISSLSDVARINGSTSPIWENATDIEVSKEFIVTSTGNWYAESKANWITIDKTNGINGDILTVSLSENKGSARSGQVIITVGNTKTVLTVNQCAYLPEFPSITAPEYSDGIGTPTVISSGINSILVKWDSAPQVEYYKVELLSYKAHGSKHVEAESPTLRKGESQYEFTGLNLQPGQVYTLSISQKSHWGYTGHYYYFTPKDESAWVHVEDESLIDYELGCDEDCVRVDIESSGVWTASTETDWIMIDSEHITKEQMDKIGVDSLYYSDYSGKSGEDMYISVLANPDKTYRYGTITVRSGGAEATIEISQAPYYEIA
ncbi:MAG: BACON domain-containing protein, partial [Clostridia bacterium]|nr:BACON domain-containing protein [Clostridia bacterium]